MQVLFKSADVSIFGTFQRESSSDSGFHGAMYLYIVALLLIIMGVVFRKQLSKFGTFISASLHAFATEYNDAYAVNDGNDEKAD